MQCVLAHPDRRVRPDLVVRRVRRRPRRAGRRGTGRPPRAARRSRRASSSARSLTSTAVTRASGTATATARPITPYPQPRSSTSRASTGGDASRSSTPVPMSRRPWAKTPEPEVSSSQCPQTLVRTGTRLERGRGVGGEVVLLHVRLLLRPFRVHRLAVPPTLPQARSRAPAPVSPGWSCAASMQHDHHRPHQHVTLVGRVSATPEQRDLPERRPCSSPCAWWWTGHPSAGGTRRAGRRHRRRLLEPAHPAQRLRDWPRTTVSGSRGPCAGGSSCRGAGSRASRYEVEASRLVRVSRLRAG